MSLAWTPLSFNVLMRALALSLLAARASLALAERVSTPRTTRRVSGVPFTSPTPRAAMDGRPVSVDTVAAGGAPAALRSPFAAPGGGRGGAAAPAGRARAGGARRAGGGGGPPPRPPGGRGAGAARGAGPRRPG